MSGVQTYDYAVFQQGEQWAVIRRPKTGGAFQVFSLAQTYADAKDIVAAVELVQDQKHGVAAE